METYSVEIVNPKAVKLLQDLADMELIVLKPTSSSPKQITEEEKSRAREAVMRGSSSMNVEAMLDHLQESRQDRKLPFREDE